MIKKILQNRRFMEIFWYVFFGGLTTVVNFVVYFIIRNGLAQNLWISNTFAWLASVLFAFVTNRIWVFHSKTTGFQQIGIEFIKFVFYRLLSYGIDMTSMYILIEHIGITDFWAKFWTQFLVVVANYIFSKLLIFTKSEEITKK